VTPSKNTGNTPAQAPMVSPWADAIVNAALPLAPKDGSLQAKTEFIRALTEKIKACVEFEKWDPRTMQSVVAKKNFRSVALLKQHTGPVATLQALPDGRIVSTRYDEIRVWEKNADTTWASAVISEHTGRIKCCQALPDGRIVSGGWDHSVRVWMKHDDGISRSEVLSGHTDGVNVVRALPDGRIVSGSDDRSLRVWTKYDDGTWGSEVLSGHTEFIDCLLCLPDGRIVSGSGDYTLRVWTKSDDGTWRSDVLSKHTLIPNYLQAFPDGRIVSSSYAELCIWTNRVNGTWSCKVLSPPEGGNCFQIFPDGRIASGRNDGTLRVWTKGARNKWVSEVLPRSGHIHFVTNVQALPDGRIASLDHALHVWTRGADGTWVNETLPQTTTYSHCFQVLPDGRIISGHADGTLRIWDGTPINGGTP
jgi:WD40 repeat protein